MAVVKIGQIKSTPAKAIAYISRGSATNEGLYVSTNAAVIDPSDSAAIAAQFAETRARVGVSSDRPGSVLAHHLIQSFAPGENVDAETAHRLGVQLAEEVTGGGFEYVVATHLDKDHVHNHIIFNATSFTTGRKFRCQRDTIGRIRDISDRLCQRAGLSVLPPVERANGYSMAELYLTIKGDSHKRFLRTEIDKAASAARTWEEFEGTLERAGIETSRRGSTLAFRSENMARPIRDWRLGEAFTEAAIMARLSGEALNRIDFHESMIVRNERASLLVRVPGSGGRLFLTVPRSQVVRHGKTWRAYIPANGRHPLSDRQGRLALNVATPGLYEWFATPGEVTAREHSGYLPTPGRVDLSAVHGWRASLSALRQLQDEVNARARWMMASGATVPDALAAASEALAETRLLFQTRYVALSDLADDPSASPTQIEALEAELRQLERRIDTLKRDVNALTTLTATPTQKEPTLSEQIQARARAKRRADRDSDDATERAVQQAEAEQETREVEPEPDRAATLQERIAAAAALKRQQQQSSTERSKPWRL